MGNLRAHDDGSGRLPASLRASMLLVALAVVCLGGCGVKEPPNVLVLLVDALRADRLGCYGYPLGTSPRIDELAAESLLFSHVFAQSPWTQPSIPTLFTSLYPVQHGVYEGEAHTKSGALESDVLAASYTTLAEMFRDSGYETAAFVHNAHLRAAQGFAQGFDIYQQEKLDAVEINRRFLEFVDRDRDHPFFGYLHYLDVHWPFQPEEPFRSRFLGSREVGVFDRTSWTGLRGAINSGTIVLSRDEADALDALHDGGLAQLDHQLGELLDALRKRGLLENTVILLTSDHGEELLDHGQVGHGGTLYQEVIEIPLMIRLPGAKRTGRVEHTARLIDVFPTLLGIAGIEPPPGLEGRDLLVPPPAAPEVVAETRHKSTYRVSIRRGDWKYIRTYRARRSPQVRAPEPGRYGLALGMRVKAKGFFAEDGTLRASKLRVMDPNDTDFELSGPIEFVRPEEYVFGLHGFRIAANGLLSPHGTPLVTGLAVGDWVKVEGDPEEGRGLRADKVSLLAEADHDDELEGIIGRLEEDERGMIATVGNAAVIVTDDTRIRGPVETSGPLRSAVEAADPIDDPFAPARLLSKDAPSYDEQLFDLASDSGEQVDLASQAPGRIAEMREGLAAWLTRMSGQHRTRADRQSLDVSTIKELRALGYLE